VIVDDKDAGHRVDLPKFRRACHRGDMRSGLQRPARTL
jgi:hypothetical protein